MDLQMQIAELVRRRSVGGVLSRVAAVLAVVIVWVVFFILVRHWNYSSLYAPDQFPPNCRIVDCWARFSSDSFDYWVVPTEYATGFTFALGGLLFFLWVGLWVLVEWLRNGTYLFRASTVVQPSPSADGDGNPPWGDREV